MNKLATATMVTESAVILWDPKYPHNVGAIIRSCPCYGVPILRYTGDRMERALEKMGRTPREERMKGYNDVDWSRNDRPFDFLIQAGYTPVAIEVREESENLSTFVHPEKAVYVFGPEDGSLGKVPLMHSQRFVSIPTRHCLNLATAVSTVLYDRQAKLYPELGMSIGDVEGRGYQDPANSDSIIFGDE